jgi:hypothetical protein
MRSRELRTLVCVSSKTPAVAVLIVKLPERVREFSRISVAVAETPWGIKTLAVPSP